MSLPSYALRVTAMAAVSLAVLWPLLARTGDPGTARAASFGAALATVNSIVAYGLVVWSQSRSTTAFLAAVLGGMVGRMAVMLAAVVAGILVLGLPQIPLVISVISYFALFIGLELSVVNRTMRSVATAR